MTRHSVLTHQYVRARVSGIDPVTNLPFDPTGNGANQVWMAFTAPTKEPATTDWIPANWQPGGPIQQPGGPVYYLAILLVGPGAPVTLGKGGYPVWVKYRTANQVESPAMRVDFLSIN